MARARPLLLLTLASGCLYPNPAYDPGSATGTGAGTSGPASTSTGAATSTSATAVPTTGGATTAGLSGSSSSGTTTEPVSSSMSETTGATTTATTATTDATTDATADATTEAPPQACAFEPAPFACYEFAAAATLAGQVLNDAGDDNDGMVLLGMPGPGQWGDGLRVLGTTTAFAEADAWPPHEATTFAVWVSASAGLDDNNDIDLVSRHDVIEVELSEKNGAFLARCNYPGGFIEDPALVIAKATWHHVACTCTAGAMPDTCGEIRLYVDGVQSVKVATDVVFFQGDPIRPLSFAKNDGEMEADIDGCLDSVMVWAEALSAAQISALYQWYGGPPAPC